MVEDSEAIGVYKSLILKEISSEKESSKSANHSLKTKRLFVLRS